ncbi:unnamed protein product [Brassica rapa subsp. narinosa]
MVIVLAEEAWQELMCKSMILTLTPLITSFLKMSASGYHKSSRVGALFMVKWLVTLDTPVVLSMKNQQTFHTTG